MRKDKLALQAKPVKVKTGKARNIIEICQSLSILRRKTTTILPHVYLMILLLFSIAAWI